MQKIKGRRNEQSLLLHGTISFGLLNLTLSYDKINGYFISGKQTKISNNKMIKCHRVSIIYMTLQKILQIFIVVSLIADQTVPIK